MTPSVISFTCSSCGVRLTVPESMAGISGPCPRCSATIQAPAATQSSAPEPVLEPPAPTPVPIVVPQPASSAEEPTTILPEPRSKPERQATKGIETRKSTSDATLRRRQTVSGESRSSRRSSPRLTRILLPLLFVAAGGAIVYVLCYFFIPGGPGEALRRNTEPPPETSQKRQSIYPESTAPSFGNSANSAIPGGPVEDAPSLSTYGSEASDAAEVLELFLKASSLAGRLELIDRPDLQDELRDTILNRPLPEAVGITPETPAFNPIEKFTDHPFRVSFQGGEGSLAEYTILVRKREDLAPKVIVAPFLDLVGGRLARFAATPIKGPRTFHAVVEAMPRCFEENIPNPDKKFTYKLSACDIGRCAARAYASRTSSLAEQLYSTDSRIRWGKRIRATVTLEWNTTEDPAQPYIEMLDIKSLDWNS